MVMGPYKAKVQDPMSMHDYKFTITKLPEEVVEELGCDGRSRVVAE